MTLLGQIVDGAKLALALLRLVNKFVDWIEREQIRDEVAREEFRKQVDKINADIAEAREIRARTHAELDGASADELRRNPDANFRD